MFIICIIQMKSPPSIIQLLKCTNYQSFLSIINYHIIRYTERYVTKNEHEIFCVVCGGRITIISHHIIIFLNIHKTKV